MAVNPHDAYPTKTTAPTTDYPYGGAQNVTTPGDGTGTPWITNIINDIFGFQQALLSEASIVPSGSPDTATSSQYLQALKELFIALSGNQTKDGILTFSSSPIVPTTPTTVGQAIPMGSIIEKTGEGVGYGTGSGGAVTQATSKSTAVALNKPTGKITMNGAALAANTVVSFTLSNTLISANDTIVFSFGGAVNYVNYNVWVVVGNNAATIFLKNISAVSLSEIVVLNFAVIKGVIL